MASLDKGYTSATWIAIQQWFFGWILVPGALGIILYGLFFIFFYPGGLSALFEMFDSGTDDIFYTENAFNMFIIDSIIGFIGTSASAIFLKKSYVIDSANYIVNVSTLIAGGLMVWSDITEGTLFTVYGLSGLFALGIFYAATRIFLNNDRE